MPQQRHVEHHPEENHHAEDDEKLHGVAISLEFLAPLLAIFGEDKGLVGKAIGLSEHHHHQGHLAAGAIDAQLGHRIRLARGQEREEDLVEVLIHIAGNAQNQQRPRIIEHPPQQGPVEAPPEPRQLAPKQRQQKQRRQDVGNENIALGNLRIIYKEEKDQVQPDVDGDVDALERGKLHGLLLIAQIAERDGRKRIHPDGHGKHPDILRMIPAIQRPAQWPQEKEHQGDEERGSCGQGDQHRRIDLHRVLAILAVNKAEKARLHAVSEHDQRQRHVGIKVRHYAILGLGEFYRVKRHQEPVQEAAYDGAQAVDGRIFC